MDDISILNQMIKDTSKVQLEIKNENRASVTLTEPDAPDSKVVVRGLPHNAIVIKVDTFPSLDTIFTGIKEECKRSDYVIVANSNEKKVVLYVELKLTKKQEKHLIKQLKGAVCFIGYCKEIAREFWNDPDFLSNFNYRFVVFTHTGGSIRKRSTRISNKHRKNDTPEKALKIAYTQKFDFNHLTS